MSELAGQMEIGSLLHKRADGPMEGWDAEGRLINPEVSEDMDANDAEGRLIEPGMSGDCEGMEAEGHVIEAGKGGLYEGMDAGDADRLRYLAAGIRSDLDGARERVLHAGMLLIEARNRCPQGRWLRWIEAEVRWSERTVQQAMKLYETYGARELPEAYRALDASHLVELLALPGAARDAMAERAAAEGMSVRRLKAEIAKLKEAEEGAQTRMALMDDRAAEDAGTVRQLTAEVQKGREAADAAEARAAAAAEEAERCRQDMESMEKSMAAIRETAAKANDRATEAEGRMRDALNRASASDAKLAAAQKAAADAEARAKALEAREPERVEVAPEGMAEEMEALRAQVAQLEREKAAARRPAVSESAAARFKWSYERLNGERRNVMAILDEVRREDAGAGEMYRAALIKFCRMMLEGLEAGGHDDE